MPTPDTTNWPLKAEKFASLSQAAGNITFTPKNDVIFNHHPFFEPDIRVAKLDADRESATPLPNLEWNTPKPDTDHYLDSDLGLRDNGNGVIWRVDMGTRGGVTPKLVGWNTNTDRLERSFT